MKLNDDDTTFPHKHFFFFFSAITYKTYTNKSYRLLAWYKNATVVYITVPLYTSSVHNKK